MGLNFSTTDSSQTIHRPPRVVHIVDTLAGCPNSSRTNPLLTASITTTGLPYFYIIGSMIRNSNGRNDMQLYVSGPSGSGWSSSFLQSRLNYTSTTTWDNVSMRWSGSNSVAGTYTFEMRATTPSQYGCQTSWGSLSLLCMER